MKPDVGAIIYRLQLVLMYFFFIIINTGHIKPIECGGLSREAGIVNNVRFLVFCDVRICSKGTH